MDAQISIGQLWGGREVRGRGRGERESERGGEGEGEGEEGEGRKDRWMEVRIRGGGDNTRVI